MRAIVRGVHVRVTPSLKAYVERHLLTPLARILPTDAAVADVQLVVTRGLKEQKECRVTLHMPRNHTLQVTERDDNLYACIAFARDRIERAAKRVQERRRHAASSHRPFTGQLL